MADARTPITSLRSPYWVLVQLIIGACLVIVGLGGLLASTEDPSALVLAVPFLALGAAVVLRAPFLRVSLAENSLVMHGGAKNHVFSRQDLAGVRLSPVRKSMLGLIEAPEIERCNGDGVVLKSLGGYARAGRDHNRRVQEYVRAIERWLPAR